MIPVLIIYALESQMEKTVMIQIFNFCFFPGKISQTSVFVKNDLMVLQTLKLSIPLAVVGFFVMLAGMKFRDRIRVEIFCRWLRCLLAVMACVLLIQYVRY